MMALDSAVVILMGEALAVLLVVAVVLFFLARRKRSQEIGAIDSFISELDEQASIKNQPLDHLLSKTCGFDPKTVQETLQEVSASERALMQCVIQLFLERKMDLLNEIDQSIGNLSEPYCKLLANKSSGESGSRPATDDSQAANNLHALERINQQLVRQLDTAMQTIDEITAEYTRVFSGNQTELELENSSKKMLQIFQDAIRDLKQTSEDQGAS